ncbi:MAG: hypothetical protein GTN46_05185 [Gammaproteobacteria bacterium]|nr:hypothetical protein [Gammaproteobacteria bacterium]NIO62839.1 hypothetical protein [Gammaproteobacteria bacterium]NIT40914.1 hypothetical protein [Gammaproteobacteria bacterium]
MKNIALFAVSIIVTASLAGCSSMQPVGEELSQQDIIQTISPGDEIVIRKLNESGPSSRHKITVKTIDDEKITTQLYADDKEDTDFYLSEIEVIETRQFSGKETAKGTAATGGVVAGLGLAFVYLIGSIAMILAPLAAI